MNKLFLIGNGFDLAHGLPTRYTDFILWYLNKVFSKFMSITAHPLQYKDGLMEMRRYSNFEPIAPFTSIQSFKYIMEAYKIDYEFKSPFFRTLINSADEYNWVDIESQYYIQLTKLYDDIESEKVNKEHAINNNLKPLNLCFDLIKTELIEHLQTIETNKSYDKNIGQHFEKELFQFREESRDLPEQEVAKIQVLNFNYTSTIENYINNNVANLKNYLDKKGRNRMIDCSINYIHGKLKEIEKNPIIFGYGDEMDSYYEKIERLNSNEFLEHIKSFGYLKVNNYRNLLRFIESSEYEVFIMGHSCGLSDRVLLNSIFEHKNCTSIKIFYHQKSEGKNDFFIKTQEISRHFSAKGKEKMRTIIVPEEDCQPLTSSVK